MRTGSAGTVESMDCIVTASEGAPGSGVQVRITGASAARFGASMRKVVAETASRLNAKDVEIVVQDNGALDLVLAARTEAALSRMGGAA